MTAHPLILAGAVSGLSIPITPASTGGLEGWRLLGQAGAPCTVSYSAGEASEPLPVGAPLPTGARLILTRSDTGPEASVLSGALGTPPAPLPTGPVTLTAGTHYYAAPLPDSKNVALQVPGASDLALIGAGVPDDPGALSATYSALLAGSYLARFTVPADGEYSPTLTHEALTIASLTSGQAVQVDVGYREWVYFKASIPQGATSLAVQLAGADGDADLYLARGAPPTLRDHAAMSDEVGSSESLSVTNPEPGVWCVGVRGYQAATGLTLTATWS